MKKILEGVTGAEAAETIYNNDLLNAIEIKRISDAVKFGKNKYNCEDPDIMRGKYIAGDGSQVGAFLGNEGLSVSGYIPIKSGQTLISNNSRISNAVGINVYNSNLELTRTENMTNKVTANEDGYIRVTTEDDAALSPCAFRNQVEEGDIVTEYEPYGIVGDADLEGIKEAFTEKLKFDEITTVIPTTVSGARQFDIDIRGWGATFNVTANSFNALVLPGGSGHGVVPPNREWSSVRLFVKNSQTSNDIIAESPLFDIEGVDILPAIVFPLMDGDNFKTLSASDFSGSSYFVGIWYYNAEGGIAFGGMPYGTGANSVAGTSVYSTTENIALWSNYAGGENIAVEHVLVENPAIFQHLKELDNLPSNVFETPEIVLPNKISAVVGDTLQLFYKGIIKAVNPYNYDIVINCSKGAWFPRYFEVTPTAGDIGDHTLQIKVKNGSGDVLASATTILEIRGAGVSPAATTKILSIGDSLTNARIWPSEAYRRLTATGGSPEGKGFSNISFVGRKKFDATNGVEGNSGWSWSDYVTVGRKAFTFAVSGVTVQPTIESVYKDANNKTYTMWWDYSSTSLKFLVDDMVSTPPTSGTLTKVSGTGDAIINYSARVQSSGNPFWNDTTNGLDVVQYVNKWCGGSVTAIYCLLTWNAQYGNRTDFSAFTGAAATLFNLFKSAYPSIKIKLMGVQVSDLLGGVRVDGSPSENTYTDTYGLVVTALNMNKAYQKFADENADFVEFIAVSPQVDSEYNMPTALKPVNTRNSTYTERIGTNDVHPDENGYKQIGDAAYRNITVRYCQ